jgi:hypothetical protein
MDVELAQGPSRADNAAHNAVNYLGVRGVGGDRGLQAPAHHVSFSGQGAPAGSAPAQGLEELAAE